MGSLIKAVLVVDGKSSNTKYTATLDRNAMGVYEGRIEITRKKIPHPTICLAESVDIEDLKAQAIETMIKEEEKAFGRSNHPRVWLEDFRTRAQTGEWEPTFASNEDDAGSGFIDMINPK